MTMIRKLVRATVNVLGDDEVEVVMSTAALARDGHVLEPQGCSLANYQANPIVLWSHDPDKPIGNAEDIAVSSDQIRARIKFAPLGISAKADEIRGLMKAGVVRAVSVGFDATDGEPIDPRNPRGGQRFTQWELLELSAVSVPSDTGAVVTNRSHGDALMPELTSNDPNASPRAPRTRSVVGGQTRAVTVFGQRGLYEVAQLCYMLEQLGYKVDQAKYEAAIEGDGSEVPGMLAGVLHDLGDVLLAMTKEEVAEALANHDIELDDPDDVANDEILLVDERQHISAAASPRARAFRRGWARAKLRAGKTLSADTVRGLRDARAMHEEGMELCRSALRKHKDGLGAIDDMMDGAGVAKTDDTTTDTSSAGGADEGARSALARNLRTRQADLLSLAGQS